MGAFQPGFLGKTDSALETFGIIAVEDQDYDSKRWWESSDGVRTVIGEMIAYVYARLSP